MKHSRKKNRNPVEERIVLLESMVMKMKAALFEIKSWIGNEKYIFKGDDASEILRQFERVQDLSCLVSMGRENEDEKGQKQLDKLEKILKKHHSNELSMKDLKSFNIKLGVGSMKCKAIAENDDEAEALIKANPNIK